LIHFYKRKMSNAGAPSVLTPMAWPVGYVATAFIKPDSDKPPKNNPAPYYDIPGHCTAFIAAIRSWLVAYACIFYLPGLSGLEAYPALGPAKIISFDWIAHILTRNLLATWIICGMWDWFLYFSPLKNKLHKYKMNPVYPKPNQIKHDAFWTTSASISAAVIEIVLCYLWANRTLPMQDTLSDAPVSNLVVALLTTHYRIPHFHLIHRMMHPWRTTTIPDIGKYLYKKVHSLHHKSYNPTAFSGTSMHPIESTLYYSAALVPVAFGLHPVHALAVIVDCGMGAWLGHDGFQWPGAGDYFHLLHHAHFDCNYGAIHVPLDWLFGTYAGSKEDLDRGKQY